MHIFALCKVYSLYFLTNSYFDFRAFSSQLSMNLDIFDYFFDNFSHRVRKNSNQDQIFSKVCQLKIKHFHVKFVQIYILTHDHHSHVLDRHLEFKNNSIKNSHLFRIGLEANNPCYVVLHLMKVSQ